MFGFVTKFKKDVTAGFTSIHERLITLEAKVGALFEHAKTTATADVAKVEAAPAAVAAVPAETVAAVEAVPAEVVAEVKANV